MDLIRRYKDLVNKCLIGRSNKIYQNLFSKSIDSIRQICVTESASNGIYRFLKNDRISEADIIRIQKLNCVNSRKGKYVI